MMGGELHSQRQLLPGVARHFCEADLLGGSTVVRHSPTSPERSRPHFGLWPSRTGLDRSTKTYRRSPGSRACCYSACAGSKTTQDRIATRVNAAAVLPSSTRNGVGILIHRLFEAQ